MLGLGFRGFIVVRVHGIGFRLFMVLQGLGFRVKVLG